MKNQELTYKYCFPETKTESLDINTSSLETKNESWHIHTSSLDTWRSSQYAKRISFYQRIPSMYAKRKYSHLNDVVKWSIKETLPLNEEDE
jgi:hypothetical protein